MENQQQYQQYQQQQQQQMNKKVEFQAVRTTYPLNEDLYVYFTIPTGAQFKVETGDWIGIFKVGWTNLKDNRFYQMVMPEQTWGKQDQEQYGQIVFESEFLPRETEQYYQFVYVKKGDFVKGVSKPFTFEEFEVIDKQDRLNKQQVLEFVPEVTGLKQIINKIRNIKQQPEQQYQQQPTTRFLKQKLQGLQHGIEQVLGESLVELEQDLKHQQIQGERRHLQQLEQPIQHQIKYQQRPQQHQWEQMYKQEQQQQWEKMYNQEQQQWEQMYRQEQPKQWEQMYKQEQQHQWEQMYRQEQQQQQWEKMYNQEQQQWEQVYQQDVEYFTKQMQTLENRQQYQQLRKVHLPRLYQEVEQTLIEQYLQEQEPRTREQARFYYQLKSAQQLIQNRQREVEIQQQERYIVKQVEEFTHKIQTILRQNVELTNIHQVEMQEQQKVQQYVRRYETLLRQKLQVNFEKRQQVQQALLQTILKTVQHLKDLQQNEIQFAVYFRQQLNQKLREIQEQQMKQNIDGLWTENKEQVLRELLKNFQITFFEQRRPQQEILRRTHRLLKTMVEEIENQLVQIELVQRYPVHYHQYQQYQSEYQYQQQQPLRLTLNFDMQTIVTVEWVRQMVRKLRELEQVLRTELFEILPYTETTETTLRTRWLEKRIERLTKQIKFFEIVIAQPEEMKLNIIFHQLQELEFDLMEQQFVFGSTKQQHLRMTLIEMIREKILAILPIIEQHSQYQRIFRQTRFYEPKIEYTTTKQIKREQLIQQSVQHIERLLTLINELEWQLVQHQTLVQKVNQTEVNFVRNGEELKRQLLVKIRELRQEQTIVQRRLQQLIQEIQIQFPEYIQWIERLTQQITLTERLTQKLNELEVFLNQQQFTQVYGQTLLRFLQQIKDLHFQMQMLRQQIQHFQQQEVLNYNLPYTTFFTEFNFEQPETIVSEFLSKVSPVEVPIIRSSIYQVAQLQKQYNELRKIKGQLQMNLWNNKFEKQTQEVFPIEYEIKQISLTGEQQPKYVRFVEQILAQLEHELNRMQIQTVEQPMTQKYNSLFERQPIQSEFTMYTVQPKNIKYHKQVSGKETVIDNVHFTF